MSTDKAKTEYHQAILLKFNAARRRLPNMDPGNVLRQVLKSLEADDNATGE